MLGDFLKSHITSQAKYVDYGYGQVEPNHLSAQRNGKIYAQLPADSAIDVLEQGQFVKYDYANGLVNFTGAGEWMLVYNEIKLYRDDQVDCEFALIKDKYNPRVYSPFGTQAADKQSRFYNGVDAEGNDSITVGGNTYKFDDVTGPADYRDMDATEDPFHIVGRYTEALMPEGTTMVPRVFKTDIGDIFTTNTVNEDTLEVGDELVVGDDGILTKTAGTNAGTMKWQVVKVYNMPDYQKGVKIMRIA